MSDSEGVPSGRQRVLRDGDGAAIVGGIKHLKSKKNKPANDKPKTKKKIHLRAPWTITEETVPEKTEDADKEVVEEPSDEEE